MKKRMMITVIVLCMFSLQACGSKGMNPHILTYRMDNLYDVVISYDEEDITFLKVRMIHLLSKNTCQMQTAGIMQKWITGRNMFMSAKAANLYLEAFHVI